MSPLVNIAVVAVIVVVVGFFMGCRNQVLDSLPTYTPYPTYTPAPTVVIPTPMPTKVVDERADIMESLILFNNTENNFVEFIRGTGYVFQLDGDIYHVTFVSWTQTAHGLVVYNNAITNWTPPDNSYSDRLIEMKKAELYRIQHFSELTEKMLVALPSEDDVALQSVYAEFIAWKDDPRNKKSMELQNTILKELDINHDDVNFLYMVPSEKPEENFNDSLAPGVHGL